MNGDRFFFFFKWLLVGQKLINYGHLYSAVAIFLDF